MVGHRINLLDAVNLVVPEGHTHHIVAVGHEDVHRVALHAESAALQVDVVAHVEGIDQSAQQHVAVKFLSFRCMLMTLSDMAVGPAHAIDARHRRDHHHVFAAAEQQGRHGRESQAVNLFVDGQVFLDIGVGGGQVGLGLVVVVVRHVVLHGIVGEEPLHLLVELGGQRLVVAQDEGGALMLLDDVGHGEGLARAGDAQQHLRPVAPTDALGQLAYGLGLIARGLIV